MAHVVTVCTKNHCNVACVLWIPFLLFILVPPLLIAGEQQGAQVQGIVFECGALWRALHTPTCGCLSSYSSHVQLACETRILINISAFSCARTWMLLMIVGLPPYSAQIAFNPGCQAGCELSYTQLTGFFPRIRRIFSSGNILSNPGKFRLFWPYDITIGSGRSTSYGDRCVRDQGQLE